jgi:hypothetical protein
MPPVVEQTITGPLQAPANKAEREKCERAQAYLRKPMDQDWPLPTWIEEMPYGVARVWWVYEDTWLGDDDPDFEFFVCIPVHEIWGRKKRDAYLKQRGDQT